MEWQKTGQWVGEFTVIPPREAFATETNEQLSSGFRALVERAFPGAGALRMIQNPTGIGIDF